MPDTIVIEIEPGKIEGALHGEIAAFKGIPYGYGVSGAGRWRRAQPPRPWTGLRTALDYGPQAIQIGHEDLGLTSPELEELLLAGQPSDSRWRRQSEECLTLNIWSSTPMGGGRRPVMFWCHGGGYHGETPPVWWFDGENLAREGSVVVVTVRHRVGTLGFLHLADLPGAEDYEDSGNVGMLDLIAALQWVRANISGFGGDPDNITVFGESGGGAKISVLLAMPEAKGLFHKAIIQSGYQMHSPSREEATRTTCALLEELGLESGDVGLLPTVPAKRFIAAQARLMGRVRKPWEIEGLASFEPVVDGVNLPTSPFHPVASPIGRDVPLIIGTCATEATFLTCGIPQVFDLSRPQRDELLKLIIGDDYADLLVHYEEDAPAATPSELFFAVITDYMLRMNSIRLAELKSAQGAAPVYMYLLQYRTDVLGGKFGTPHTLEIPLVLGHCDSPMLGTSEDRFAVARQMGAAWAAFAHTGHPGSAYIPPWPAYDPAQRSTMTFDIFPHVVEDPLGRQRRAWRDRMDR